jgi:LPS-assembly protein
VGDIASQTLTPIVVASVAPPGGSSHIPNEDSLDFELDDVNVFSPQPFTGWDRVLGGPRVSYGGQYTIASRGNQSADIAIGQAYQVRPEQTQVQGTGLDHNFSDIVGRVQVNPSSNLALGWRYRLDKSAFDLRRSEISSVIGPKALQLSTSYVFYDRLNPTSVFGQREQISNTLRAQFSHYWRGEFYNTENLGADAGPVQSGLRISYEDECLLLTGDAGVRHTTSTIFADGHYLLFTVNFKTLSQFPVNVF